MITFDKVSKVYPDDLTTMNGEAATGTNLADIAKKWLAGAGISGS
jgi:osmoprotectant transport system substrate-binding protein